MGGCAACCVCLLVPLLILLAIANFGLSIAEIVIGAQHLNNCPIERLIPIYLVVAGVIGLFVSFSQGHRAKGTRDQQSNGGDEKKCDAFKCLTGLITLFSFIWFIVGNVYVFKNYPNFHRKLNGTATDPLYCFPLVMDFAYYSIIAHYITFAVMIVLLCLTMCCAIGAASSRQYA